MALSKDGRRARASLRSLLASTCACLALCAAPLATTRAQEARASREPAPAASAQAASAESASEAPRVRARLDYTRDAAAARCPSDAELRDAVSARLGFEVFEGEPATRALRVHVTTQRKGLQARIEITSLEPGEEGKLLGSRELRSASQDCRELASALVLAMSLALDPSQLWAREAPTLATCPVCPVCPAPAAPVAAAQAANTDPEPPPSATNDLREQTHSTRSSFQGFTAGVGAGLSLFSLPEPSAVLLAMLGVTYTHFAAQLEGAVQPGVDALPVPAGDSLRASSLSGRLALCGRYELSPTSPREPARVAFGGCGTAGLGTLFGEGLLSGERESSLSATLGPRLFADVHLVGPLFLQARADLLAQLVRTTLQQSGAPSWSSPAVALELSSILFVRFP